ncbi:MAG: DNA replication/repair protein RecF [Armatimonadota bacterium]
MHLCSLELVNFRCYERARFEFAPGLNVILGPNASGKTTLLEAIYLLATTTSPRTSSDRALIRQGQSPACVTGVFARDGRELSIRITLGDGAGSRSGPRRFDVDGREVTGARDVIGRAQAVLFWAGELDVVKGSPADRRRFLNAALAQMSARYLDDLARYRRALRQRNELLKRLAQGAPDGRLLAPWTHALVEAGTPIVEDRSNFLTALAGQAGPLHARLGADAEELTVRYAPSVPIDEHGDVADAFYAGLEATHARELERGSTQVGPHRDDMRLQIDGADIRHFGSQGQQRTAALALTLAQAQVAGARTATQPILLLDDCLSELDPTRGAAMLDLWADREQMIVTSACCPEHLAERLSQARVIYTQGDPTACARHETPKR